MAGINLAMVFQTSNHQSAKLKHYTVSPKRVGLLLHAHMQFGWYVTLSQAIGTVPENGLPEYVSQSRKYECCRGDLAYDSLSFYMYSTVLFSISMILSSLYMYIHIII